MQPLFLLALLLPLLQTCIDTQPLKPMSAPEKLLRASHPATISVAATPAQSEVTFNLSEQQWQYRLVLIFAPSERSPGAVGVAELRDDRRSAVFLESPLNPPSLGDFECLVPPDLGARGRIHPCFQQRPYQQQRQAWESHQTGSQERDLKLVEVLYQFKE